MSLQDLLCLLTRYLEPLKEETFLTSDKVAELFGNITEIVQFQQQFLHSLEQAIELEPDFFTTDDTKLFKVGGRLVGKVRWGTTVSPRLTQTVGSALVFLRYIVGSD